MRSLRRDARSGGDLGLAHFPNFPPRRKAFCTAYSQNFDPPVVVWCAESVQNLSGYASERWAQYEEQIWDIPAVGLHGKIIGYSSEVSNPQIRLQIYIGMPCDAGQGEETPEPVCSRPALPTSPQHVWIERK